MDFTHIIVEHRNHVAHITIKRPGTMNAFRGRTCDELIHALHRSGHDRDIGAIVLAGAGDRAHCTGGGNIDTAHRAGIAGMGTCTLRLYDETDESHGGVNALKEKRQPNFREFAT